MFKPISMCKTLSFCLLIFCMQNACNHKFDSLLAQVCLLLKVCKDGFVVFVWYFCMCEMQYIAMQPFTLVHLACLAIYVFLESRWIRTLGKPFPLGMNLMDDSLWNLPRTSCAPSPLWLRRNPPEKIHWITGLIFYMLKLWCWIMQTGKNW